MDCFTVKGSSRNVNENQHFNDTESTSNFQKFIYDLFEKKGILNDLRANLRGHIVEVLKSAQTGEPPECQKHFTQRLELSYQAMNMLIAEYLLRFEFGYSLSVFVSEIPLANMVFGFAKKLLQSSDGNFENLKFNQGDVWSILNYLGVKCDSETASNIMDMYNKENVPLLMCILKCTPMYHREFVGPVQGNVSSSSDSVSSNVKSCDSLEREGHNMRSASKIASAHERCRHCAFCRTCQAKIKRIKSRYYSKKKHLTKNVKSSDIKPLNLKLLMRNIGETEQSLVDEQLKSVYEAEVDMMRLNEEKKIKRSLASHALQLQKRSEEMEKSFKAREEELERNVQEKKKFLWGMARALRDQHAQMARAMHAVKHETDRLTAKEDSLKSQLIEAEDVLKKRGEEMRKQISSELTILEGHLESMKKERDCINQERNELEQLKTACSTKSETAKLQDSTNEDLKSHYTLLKDELVILKKYLETTKLEPKCVIERSTLTEMSNVTSKINLILNNEQDADRSPLRCDSDDRIRTPNKVVNDLKKQKNVNFCTSNVDELYREPSRSRSRSRSSASSEAGDGGLQQLRDENERLKAFARQQRTHIDELSSHGARLRAELTAARFRCDAPAPSRPCSAPPPPPPRTYIQRLNSTISSSSVGWRKGAGEEVSMFANAQPRILIPGDTLPFVGVLRDRHSDNRRHLINQWRALRRRPSPLAATRLHHDAARDNRPAITITSPKNSMIDSANRMAAENVNTSQMDDNTDYQFTREKPRTSTLVETHRPREKSPMAVLRKAKETLRNSSNSTYQSASRDKSPSSVLREAKLRLRRLEIEAEAVEKSYRDFRRRQAETGSREVQERSNDKHDECIDIKTRDSKHARPEPKPQTFANTPTVAREFDRYMTEYEATVTALPYYKNRNTAIANTQPIPKALSKLELELKESEQRRDYYLETPLAEFRKLYHSQRSPVSEKSLESKESKSGAQSPMRNIETASVASDENSVYDPSEAKSKSNRIPTNKRDELHVLRDNINKMYNLQNENDNDKITNIKTASFASDENSVHEPSEAKSISNRIPTNRKHELEIMRDKINKMYNLENENDNDKMTPVADSNNTNDEQPKDESELTNKMAEIKEIQNPTNEEKTHRELLLVVESSVDTKEIDVSEREMQHQKISTKMTIIVSPKIGNQNGGDSNEHGRSVSPEQAAKLTRNDALNAIFHADTSLAHSSVEIELDLSKDGIGESATDLVKGDEDYPDDFSADVDNYNSRSDYEAQSPISLPKNSEEDNFWDT